MRLKRVMMGTAIAALTGVSGCSQSPEISTDKNEVDVSIAQRKTMEKAVADVDVAMRAASPTEDRITDNVSADGKSNANSTSVRAISPVTAAK